MRSEHDSHADRVALQRWASISRRQFLRGAGGGTLKPGRYVKHGSRPATNLFIGLAQRLGLRQLQRFGDSTGVLENI